MKGKILICAYHFPPIGTPRSFRWREFVRHLSSKGWDVDVLTIDTSPKHPNYDSKLLEDLPDRVRLFRTNPGFMHHLSSLLLSNDTERNNGTTGDYKFSLRRRVGNFLLNMFEKGFRHFFIPDEAIPWMPFALIKGIRIIKENNYDLIISSSFPFTCHVVAYFLKRQSPNSTWITDYGDPWINNPLLPLPRWRSYIDKKVESKILKSAGNLIVTTEETRDHYLKLYPFLSPKNIKVISQGFSPEEYNEVSAETTDRFRIVYTGSFYKASEPFLLFDVLKQLKQIWEDLDIVITGYLVNEDYKRYIENNGLSEIVHFAGFVPHQRAISLQKGASLLLLIGHKGGIQIPGKIYEYIAAQRPILLIKNDEADLASKIVEKLNRGITVQNNPQMIKDSLIHFHNLWQNKNLDRNFNLEYVDDYSWDNLGERLYETILEIDN